MSHTLSSQLIYRRKATRAKTEANPAPAPAAARVAAPVKTGAEGVVAEPEPVPAAETPSGEVAEPELEPEELEEELAGAALEAAGVALEEATSLEEAGLLLGIRGREEGWKPLGVGTGV